MNEIDGVLKEGYKFFPPGHFYSPIPALEDIKKAENKIWKDNLADNLPGLDLDTAGQLKLLEEFKPYYQDLPFTAEKNNKLRYYFENPAYSYSDAIFLYCMIRKIKPRQIIEIGSGYSSCVMMDTNELFFENKINITFIDPYPELLISLMKENDRAKYAVIPKRLQDCEIEKFSALQENDILFVDSTHVSKIHSDVNTIFFQILPRLKKGVYIHFHDIFYPFEYPKEWVYEGRAFNESYILRAFLEYNNDFRIIFFNTFLEYFFKDKFESGMPLCLKNLGGSIWIKKV
jgi:hypothetical protein